MCERDALRNADHAAEGERQRRVPCDVAGRGIRCRGRNGTKGKNGKAKPLRGSLAHIEERRECRDGEDRSPPLNNPENTPHTAATVTAAGQVGMRESFIVSGSSPTRALRTNSTETIIKKIANARRKGSTWIMTAMRAPAYVEIGPHRHQHGEPQVEIASSHI